MISTLTSLLSRAESADPEPEDPDDRVTDGGATVAPDLSAAEADVTAEATLEGPAPNGLEASTSDGHTEPASAGAADADPETEWEFISGMVDQAVSEETDPAESPASPSDPAPTAETSSDAAAVSSEDEPDSAPETSATVGAGPLAGIDPGAIDRGAIPILEAEAADPAAGEEVQGDRSDPATEPPHRGRDVTADSTDPAGGDRNSVLADLIAELETSELSEDERLVLREALGVSSSTSVELRLRHLQADVADLRAYADAIEQVLEQESEADRLARDLGRRIDGLRDRLDDTLAAVEEDLAVEREAREADVERLEARIGGVATTLTDSVVALHHDVEELRQDVEANSDWREDVTAAFATDD